jgi:high-affinity K+ transport system ATPase subunit B
LFNKINYYDAKEEFEMIVAKYHIKKNDLVMVTKGKEAGKSGRILKGLPREEESARREDQLHQETYPAARPAKARRHSGKGSAPSCSERDASLREM